MINFLKAAEVKLVVYQGIPPSSLSTAAQFLALDPPGYTNVLYHSGVSVHNIAPNEASLIGGVVAAARDGTRRSARVLPAPCSLPLCLCLAVSVCFCVLCVFVCVCLRVSLYLCVRFVFPRTWT